jgi:hypothetical protein
MGLLPRVYLFNKAFYWTCYASLGFPKLNHKRPAHNEFRIRLLPPTLVGILWVSCRFFVRPSWLYCTECDLCRT